jgi:hypothetical protein
MQGQGVLLGQVGVVFGIVKVAAPGAITEPPEAPELSDRLPSTRRRHARSPWADRPQVEPVIPGGFSVDVGSSPDTPLIARFRATAPVPVTSAEHQVYDRLLHLRRIIERALRALRSFASALTKHEDDRQRRWMAKLETDKALDDSRAHRAAADAALRRWEVAQPWQMMRNRAFGDKSRQPWQWRELESVAPLLAVLPDSDRYQVEALLPKAMPDAVPGKVMDGPEPKPPGFQRRSSARPVP